MPTTTTDLTGPTFLSALLQTAAGREHLLSVAVDAEEGDETGIFDRLADAVDVPELAHIVRVHRDDEVRHAGLYRDCLRRNGYTKQELPDSLSVVAQVRGSAEGPVGVRTPEEIVMIYAVLLAIEERGVERFPMIADAFDAYDPETAETYRRVTRDERGHVRYCQRIGRHYAGSDRAWDDAVAFGRQVEVEAFARATAAQAAYCAERGWVDLDVITDA